MEISFLRTGIQIDSELRLSEITVEKLINEETVQKLFILPSWIFSLHYTVSFSGFLFAMAMDFLTWPLTFFLTFIPQVL